MSRAFSDTSTNSGLVQEFERETGKDLGYVSGNTNRLKEFASLTRSAWDRYIHRAIMSSGTWDFDDSNHSGDPVYKANLVSGTRQYALTSDADSALILTVKKVMILPGASDTEYTEIFPINEEGDDPSGLSMGVTTGGVPLWYNKTKNELSLDPIPNYNATNGLKVYVDREPAYFVSTDTTKKPGCPGIHHDYFFLYPAMIKARRDGLANFQSLQLAVFEMERDIEEFFSRRARDESHVISAERISFR